MLLPREHLPLACLDLGAPNGDLPSARQFQAQIRILELEGRLGSSLLIARSPSSNAGSAAGFSSASSVFAMERDEAGLYVLCKLGSWVDIQKLGEQATAVCQQRMPAPSAALAPATGQAPALVTPQVYKERGRKRLAIAELQSIVRRRPAASQLAPDAAAAASQGDELPSPALEAAEASQPASERPAEGKEAAGDLPARPPSQTQAQQEAAAAPKPAVLPTPPASDATKRASTEPTAPPGPVGPPTADEIFQSIRHQYCEALYHSLVGVSARERACRTVLRTNT